MLKNGTTAVSQINQIPFVLQSITYASGVEPITFTFESPFPIEVDDAIATYTGLDPSHNFNPFTVKTVPSGFIHQPLIVQQEDAKLGGILPEPWASRVEGTSSVHRGYIEGTSRVHRG